MDIGSDLGTFVNDLNLLGIDAEGIESEQDRVDSSVSPKIKCATFGLDYSNNKKYDLITLPQVIYFLGDIIPMLLKLKSMLNPDGMIFIVTVTPDFDHHVSKYPNHTLYSKNEYSEICSKVGLKLIDYTDFKSNIGTAFNNANILSVIRILLFMTGLKKPIEKKKGNNAYILLRN
ncbi:MAG: methyltransferase domain-containing protein [Nanoarchaeota archaeon]